MNLLDLAAVAVPAGFRADGLPFGVTLFGPAFSDGRLAALAGRLHRAQGLSLGATGHRPLPEPGHPEAGPGGGAGRPTRPGGLRGASHRGCR